VFVFDTASGALVSSLAVEVGALDALAGLLVGRFPVFGARGLAWSPDGARLAVTGDGGQLRIWDVRQRKVGRDLAGHDGPVHAAWVATVRLVAGGREGKLRVWDVVSGTTVAEQDARAPIAALAVHPAGDLAATASPQGSLRIWRLSGGGALAGGEPMEGAGGPVKALAISPDRRVLVAGTHAGALSFFDVASARHRLVRPRHVGAVNAIVYTPDGRRILSAGTDRRVRPLDVASGADLAPDDGHADGVTHIAVARDGRRVASADSTGRVMVWTLGTRRGALVHGPDEGKVALLAFSPDGTTVHIGIGAPSTLVSRHASSGQEVRRASLPHPSFPAALLPDGRSIACRGPSKSIVLRAVDAGTPVRSLLGVWDDVSAIAASPDMRLAITGGTGLFSRPTLSLVDLAKDSVVPIDNEGARVYGMAFSPRGDRLAATFHENVAQIHATATGEVLASMELGVRRSGPIAFSSDGATVFTASPLDPDLEVWTADGTRRGRLPGHPFGIGALAALPDGSVVTGGEEGSLLVWDVAAVSPAPASSPAPAR
jgi:WD40 repeat protein